MVGKRAPRVLGLIVAAVVGTAACSSGGSGGSTGGRSDDKLTIGLSSPVDTLDPQSSGTTTAFLVDQQVLDTLVTLDAEGEIVPSLATSYEYDPVKLQIVFHLDPDATFSNGDPVTSSDVAFSVDTWKKGTIYASYYESINGVSTPDPQTAVMELKNPNAALLGVLAISTSSIYPKDFAGQSAEDYYKSPIGSGPYQIASANLSEKITLVPNKFARTKGEGRFTDIEFKVIPDSNQLQVQFQSGAVDIVDLLSIPTAQQFPQDSIQSTTGFLQSIVLTNAKDDNLKNTMLRQAISKAIDRTALVDGVFGGLADLATAVEPQGVPNVEPCATCDWATRDLAGAKDLVARSGYDGSVIKLTAGSGDLASQAIVPMLAEAGITVELVTKEPSALLGDMVKQDYEMLILDNTALAPTPLDPIGYFATTENYYTGADVTAAQEAVKMLEASTDAAGIKKASQYYEQWAFDEAHIIPVVALPNIYAVDESIEGFKASPAPRFAIDQLRRAE